MLHPGCKCLRQGQWHQQQPRHHLQAWGSGLLVQLCCLGLLQLRRAMASLFCSMWLGAKLYSGSESLALLTAQVVHRSTQEQLRRCRSMCLQPLHLTPQPNSSSSSITEPCATRCRQLAPWGSSSSQARQAHLSEAGPSPLKAATVWPLALRSAARRTAPRIRLAAGWSAATAWHFPSPAPCSSLSASSQAGTLLGLLPPRIAKSANPLQAVTTSSSLLTRFP